VESYLRRRFEGRMQSIEVVAKEDLGLVRRRRRKQRRLPPSALPRAAGTLSWF
jgi:hypothetical protein